MGVKEIFMAMNRAVNAPEDPSYPTPSGKPVIHEYDRFMCEKRNLDTTIGECITGYVDANLNEGDFKFATDSPCHKCKKGSLNRKHFAES